MEDVGWNASKKFVRMNNSVVNTSYRENYKICGSALKKKGT